MLLIVSILLGPVSAFIGLFIYKYEKFNLAYLTFYSRSIEKYSERKLVINKKEVAQFVGKHYAIWGIIFSIVGLIILILGINEQYIFIPVLPMAICNIYARFYMKNLIIK